MIWDVGRSIAPRNPYESPSGFIYRGTALTMFTQADESSARKHGGTGLRLTISKKNWRKRWAERSRCKVRLAVEPPSGLISGARNNPMRNVVLSPSYLGTGNLTQARILIMDVDQINCMVLIRSLEAMGGRVNAVASGAKVLETLCNTHRVVKDVKIIILTSLGRRGDAFRHEALSCSGCLLTLDEQRRRILANLRKGRMKPPIYMPTPWGQLITLEM
jgi:hypothetical protein